MLHSMNKENIHLKSISKSIYYFNTPDFEVLNKNILEKFNIYKDHKNTNKSHFFEGRYENIYISSSVIDEIQVILSYAKQCVQKITSADSTKSGLWFNSMEPGHITLPHTHDDADELYSAVYYVKVPDNSGDLIITENSKDVIIKPKEGMLVLFPPDLQHHVTTNNSCDSRLSLGINIGN